MPSAVDPAPISVAPEQVSSAAAVPNDAEVYVVRGTVKRTRMLNEKLFTFCAVKIHVFGAVDPLAGMTLVSIHPGPVASAAYSAPSATVRSSPLPTFSTAPGLTGVSLFVSA